MYADFLANSLAQSRHFYLIRIDLTGSYTYVNQAFKDKYAHISSSFVGENFNNSLHPDDIQKCTKTASKCIAEPGKNFPCKVRKPAKDGSFFWTEWEYCGLANDKGQVFEIQCIGFDVTELTEKQKSLTVYTEKLNNSLEQARKFNNELLKANEELDNFVYRISHDLRAPVTSSLGLIEVISLEEDPNAVKGLLGMQEKTLKRLDKLIIDILDYSRNARTGIELEKINGGKAIEEVLKNFRQEKPHIQVNLVCNEVQPFYTDLMRFQIILINLISNAYKYSSPYAEVCRVNVSLETDNRHALLTVADNGIGIKKDYLDRVFEMFYRASNYATGSGLGLYIVNESVKKLGGSIKVDSKPDTGTCFQVFLPNRVPGN